MARTRTSITIDDKIEQQKLVVSKAKDKYDAAVEELEKLMRKRDELRNKELLSAISSSNRSYEEIMEFLQG
ncbi:MAG: ErpK protein [Lachnospiraceae bacterium]|nr:ErpK protein [Lachnospiraceae bacterium]